ncbi:hypothetical protein ACOMHN_024566 [Nucella lapillus]
MLKLLFNLLWSLLRFSSRFLGVKLFFIGSFLSLLFIFLRLAERTFQWQDTLQPATLPTWVLRDILEQRGISYQTTGLEKSDLVKLVEKSGRVSKEGGDYFLTSAKDKMATAVSRFDRGNEFHRQVERSRRDIWLVMVLTDDKHTAKSMDSVLPEESWSDLRYRLSQLDIRVCVFHCREDLRWCKNRKWRTSTFYLYVPQANKEISTSYVYSGSFRMQQVYMWILEILQDRMMRTSSPVWLELTSTRLRFQSPLHRPEMHIVTLVRQNQPPPFILTLSGQFPDLAQFVWVSVKADRTSLLPWTSKANISADNLTFPVILIATSEGVYHYGQTPTECYTYTSLRTFLDYFKPSQDTAVNISFIAATLLGILEVVIYKKRLLMRVVTHTLINYGAVISFLLLTDSVGTYSISKTMTTGIDRACRYLAITGFGALIRGDVVLCVHHYYSVLLSLALAILFMKKLAPLLTGHVYEEDDTDIWLESPQRSSVRSNRNLDREQHQSSSDEEVQQHVLNGIRFVQATTTPGQEVRLSSVRMQLTPQAEEILMRYLADMAFVSTAAESRPHHSSADLPMWSFSTEAQVPEGFRLAHICVICQNKFCREERMTGLPCQHTFHHACLIQWLNAGASQACPVCRQ